MQVSARQRGRVLLEFDRLGTRQNPSAVNARRHRLAKTWNSSLLARSDIFGRGLVDQPGEEQHNPRQPDESPAGEQPISSSED
jgi:hypothetical protein